mmetsp:Transcript_64875/g.204910  ORF Transcript_64875/g.204910 Transcript_64875/m.204910 type:complete len:246 (-) Transcript_64875:513-1250(-)
MTPPPRRTPASRGGAREGCGAHGNATKLWLYMDITASKLCCTWSRWCGSTPFCECLAMEYLERQSWPGSATVMRRNIPVRYLVALAVCVVHGEDAEPRPLPPRGIDADLEGTLVHGRALLALREEAPRVLMPQLHHLGEDHGVPDVSLELRIVEHHLVLRRPLEAEEVLRERHHLAGEGLAEAVEEALCGLAPPGELLRGHGAPEDLRHQVFSLVGAHDGPVRAQEVLHLAPLPEGDTEAHELVL